MSPTPEVRPARAADIPRMMEIRAAVRENRLRDLVVAADDYRLYVTDGRCWAAEADGALLGFAALDETDGSLWALFVDPAGEGRGLGSALLAAAIAEARRRGLAALALTTEAGTRAEAFYRRRGFSGGAPDGRNIVRLTLPLS